MTAIRSARSAEGKFVQISNAALQDRRLSWRARGILAFVLSMPPDKTLTAKWLETQAPDGRQAVRSALRELEACGYYRRTRTNDGHGHWAWEQIMSDAPAGEGSESSQAAPCDGNPSDGNPHDGEPSDKGSNTSPANTHERKMASRRAHASSASEQRTVQTVVRDVKSAVAEVHGEREAEELTDESALGLWARFCRAQGIRDIHAYMVKILADAPYLDTLMANCEPVCCDCVKFYDDCECQAEA